MKQLAIIIVWVLARLMKRGESLPSLMMLLRRSMLIKPLLTPLLAELENILVNLGGEILKDDVKNLILEICDPEDDYKFFPYIMFVDRLTAKA
jgi:hypothetical protein